MKYAIVEYETYGKWTPVLVEIGPWWKLMWSLMKWSNERPFYASPYFSGFSYVDGKANHHWFNKAETVRKIVKIGQDMDEKPMAEHMRIGRWF